MPHTVVMHMRQTYHRSVWTPVLVSQTSKKKLFCCFSVQTCWTHPMQTKTPGSFLLSSFYPLYQNYKDFCSLLVCAYCICQHLMSCGHYCFELGFYCRFYITCGVGEKRGEFESCFFYSGCSKLFIWRSFHLFLHTPRFNNADVQLRR